MSNYTVFVDDNFHYRDEGERYELGKFEQWDAAVAACKNIIDEFIRQNYKAGMKAEDLYKNYLIFGEDPFIIQNNPESPTGSFSAWDYAKQRCQEICAS